MEVKKEDIDIINEFMEKDLSFISGDEPTIDYDITSSKTTDEIEPMVKQPISFLDWGVGYVLYENEENCDECDYEDEMEGEKMELVDEFIVKKKASYDDLISNRKINDNEIMDSPVDLPDIFDIGNRDVASKVFSLIYSLNKQQDGDLLKVATLGTIIDKIKLDNIEDKRFLRILRDKIDEKI